jgi:4-amino-4-deoxy-L-arabinose transferase-like glycosyltransferase
LIWKSVKQFLPLLPLIFVISAIAVIVHYTINNVQEKIIEDNLAIIEPIFLFVNFTALLGFFAINFNNIRKQLSKVNRYTWFFLFVIFLLGFFLRMYIAPHTHRLFFDEDIYLEIGKEILERGKGSLCNYADADGCYEYDLMKWPNGYPFILAITFLFFGVSEAVAFNLMIFLGSLSIILVFLISYLLSGKEEIGLYSALLFALIPLHIMWSATTASEPVLIFFTLLAVFCLIMATKTNSWKTCGLALVALAYAIQIKAEGGILLALAGFIILLFGRNWIKKLKDKKFLFFWMLFFFLITPYLIHISYAAKFDPWGATGKKFALGHARRNLPENLLFWIQGYPTIEHPTLFTVLAILGTFYCIDKRARIFLLLLVWFMLFFWLYVFFYAGSVRYGVDVRYSLNCYPPLIILGGYGLYALKRAISKKINGKLITIILISLVLATSYFYLPSISTPAEKIEEARQAREYHKFALKMLEKLDENCYILSHVPSIYLVAGRNSLQTWNAQNKERMKSLFEKTDCVIFDYGFWCNLEPYKSSVCKYILDNYELTVIDKLEEETGHIYVFYLISGQL